MVGPDEDVTDRGLARGIPFSSWIVIITAAGVLFGLGSLYLEQQRRSVRTVYQILGARSVARGLPAAFRVLEYDESRRELTPVQVRGSSLQNGDLVVEGTAASDTAVLDATVRFQTVDLPVGPALLKVEVSPWEGGDRTLEVPLEIVLPREELPAVLPWEPARPAEDFARIETLEGGDTILGERENDFWIRVSDGQDRPSPAHIEVLLDGQRIAEFFLGALGLGRVRVPLSKPAHELTVVAAVTGAEGRRVEDIAPLGRIRIQPTPPVIRVSPGTPARGLLVIDSEAVTERLLCGLWRGDTLIDLFAVPAPAGRARHEITVPGDGIYRVTCTDHPASEWWGDSFLVATRSPDALLDSFREALAGEPFFAGWPPSSELSPGELDLALGYLLDRAERSTLPWTRLLDTREGDQARLDAEGRRVRMAILGLIAATGFSLLLWAVAMVLRQRRTLAAIRDPELLGAGALQEHGLGRRGALLPLAFLVLATLVNVGALIYILVLVLH